MKQPPSTPWVTPPGAPSSSSCAGDLPALTARGRELARVATAAVLRLDPGQRATPGHCLLHHDGAVVLHATVPWWDLAVDTQASRHLPAHTGQLRDLRPGPASGGG